MFRVGIVGAGSMGKTHAAAWSQTPAHIAGFHSVDLAKVTALAQAYKGKRYESLDALIADVDVVDICTPTHLHHEMVLKAARAGKHIICEKPLARTTAQAEEMIAVCKQMGVHLLVAHVVRFFPDYALAKGIVERGEIGKVAIMRLTRCSFQPKLAADNWFLDVSKSGGMMLDLMIHDYDYARWVAGDVESVFAKSVRSYDPHAHGDYALAILRHKNGAISNVEGGWAYPQPMFRTALEIAGDKGLIEHPAGSSAPISIYLQKAGVSETPEVALPDSPLVEDPYTTQIKHFYEVLTSSEAVPIVTAEDGLVALQIALAAVESAQTGRRVMIEEAQ